MMPDKRADKLFWAGETDANGSPLYYFADIAAARDLEPHEVAALTPEQYTTLTNPPVGLKKALYTTSKPRGAGQSDEDDAVANAEQRARDQAEAEKKAAMSVGDEQASVKPK